MFSTAAENFSSKKKAELERPDGSSEVVHYFGKIGF
jgi:hypothetical protein